MIAEYYDAVLIHTDPTATQLEISWPVSAMLEEKLRYTGYVAPPAPTEHPQRDGDGEVLVSAGGGSVGDALFETACLAAAQMPDTRWRLLVGGSDAAQRIERLQAIGSPAVIEPARPDFRQMLPLAAASVSMCGYNTALDLLQCGTPAVLIPFDAGKEVEQGLRAQSLKPMPGFEVVTSADLTPDSLCQAIQEAISAPRRDTGNLHFDGANQAVKIAVELAEHRP